MKALTINTEDLLRHFKKSAYIEANLNALAKQGITLKRGL